VARAGIIAERKIFMNICNDLEFVIMAGGKSTRNYPQSKGLPHKSLMPFGDHKIIDEIMARLVDAGARHITIVVSNESVVKYFSDSFRVEPEVESKFEKSGDARPLNLLRDVRLPDDMDIKYVIQEKPLGTGQAMGLAYDKIKDSGRGLVMVFPDDMFVAENGAAHIYSRAVRQYLANGGRGNLAITRLVDDPSRWGIVQNGMLIEKPPHADSRDAAVGFIIFDKSVGREFYADIGRIERGEKIEGLISGELPYTLALNRSVEKDPKNAIQICRAEKDDIYLDCGTLAGYREALLYSLNKLSVFKN
jgi:UTP-glucose-1-phosphate uridylyltransferase